jgi:hypothetical protein
VNPKIFVGVAVALFAGILAIVASSGQSIISDTSEEGLVFTPEEESIQALPITIELDDFSVLEVTEKFATFEIKFKVSNPNYNSVLLQFLKYQIYDNDIRVHAGTIGERPEGFVMGSNYFIILNERPSILSDKVTIKNDGNTPELWSSLTSDTKNWKINGEAFFNLSSMTTGGENEITFEFII